MKGSALTKWALCDAMKTLMLKKPFQKISIREICECCGMSRKSFYYHYKDKYDLVNSIFQSEFADDAICRNMEEGVDLLLELARYFQENRRFYLNAFSVEGQNSFTEYFCDFLRPIAAQVFSSVFPNNNSVEFYSVFMTDALCASFKRYLRDTPGLSPEEYVERIRTLFQVPQRSPSHLRLNPVWSSAAAQA